MKAHILTIKKIFHNGHSYTDIRGVYSSADKADAAKRELVDAYFSDEHAESKIMSLFSHDYPRVAAEVRFSDGERVGFWIDSVEMNQSALV